MFFLKVNDILAFLNFLYLLKIAQYISSLESFCNWKYFSIILSILSYLLGENKFVWYGKLYFFIIKSINPIPHISIHTLSNRMLVFSKCLLWYFCFLYNFYFLLEYVQLQSCQKSFYSKMCCYYYQSHMEISDDFLLI